LATTWTLGPLLAATLLCVPTDVSWAEVARPDSLQPASPEVENPTTPAEDESRSGSTGTGEANPSPMASENSNASEDVESSLTSACASEEFIVDQSQQSPAVASPCAISPRTLTDTEE